MVGGVKVNVFVVVLFNLIVVLRGIERVEVFGCELLYDFICCFNVVVVVLLGILFVFIFILSILEFKMFIMILIFECVLVFSMVGFSLNVIFLLCDESKLLVLLFMFIGCVGFIILVLGIVK